MLRQRVVARFCTRQAHAREADFVGIQHVLVVEGTHCRAVQAHRVTGVGLAVAACTRAGGNCSLQRCWAVHHSRCVAVVNLVLARQAADGQCLGRDVGRGSGLIGDQVVSYVGSAISAG